MLNVEHLLENAICDLEKYEVHEAYRRFIESPCNIEMAEGAGIRLDDVWVMAVYCDATLRWDWKEKWEKEAETHGDVERERIEAILEKHGTYILSTIDGQGVHVGCFKGIALDADANWIIEAEVESMSETNCGDFIPVAHGEWIVNPEREYDYICSVCGGDAPEDRWRNNAILTPYCPNCGTKMKEKQ